MPPPLIRSDDTRQRVEAALERVRRDLPALDSRKHLGALRLREDPRQTQLRDRSEWDEPRR